jgi:hypothetical protein
MFGCLTYRELARHRCYFSRDKKMRKSAFPECVWLRVTKRVPIGAYQWTTASLMPI